MITNEDMERLGAELIGSWSPEKWMVDNEFPFETMEGNIQAAVVSLQSKLNRGVSTEQALGEIIANAFVLGWEAFRQYGPRKEFLR